MPHSRPMASIGHRCHELRVLDKDHNWRIVYRIDADAIVIAEVVEKKTARTPAAMIDTCQKRLRGYDKVASQGGKE
jgi:phage-related protein